MPSHRLSADRNPQLQTAWMNGSGILIWENVFGQWSGWNEKDKSTLRSIALHSASYKELFSGDDWIPLSDRSSTVSGVYISSWESKGIHLWTLVNRNLFPVDGVLMKTEFKREMKYFNLIKGEEIPGGKANEIMSFYGNIGSSGIACFLSIPKSKIDTRFKKFLENPERILQLLIRMSQLISVVQNNQLTETKKIVRCTSPREGMVTIPEASLVLNMEYTFRESGGYCNIQNISSCR